jgi:hypothetical protein
MQNDILASVTRLSDDDLVARLKGLVARDRDLTAQIVAHLAELDTRDVFLREGYGSLFVYCRDALGLSEWEAYNRIEVARAARRFPVILDMLAEGSVNLTAVRLLAPHLTSSNHREVLDSAPPAARESRRSKRSSPGSRPNAMCRHPFGACRQRDPRLCHSRRRRPLRPRLRQRLFPFRLPHQVPRSIHSRLVQSR